LIIRAILVCVMTVVYPLYQTRKANDPNDSLFFPIPPNRQCIEEVDMLLHIPVALDYFYDYLDARKMLIKD